MKCVQFSRDEHFFARPKRSKTSRKKCAKRAQIGAKKCKRAQIQKTLPLNRKRLLTHFYLYLSEHSDTICREKCKTTARKNLWRADFSKTSTFSFTSVNLHFRAETQRHVNLRYFGGPRMLWLWGCFSSKTGTGISIPTQFNCPFPFHIIPLTSHVHVVNSQGVI